MSRSVYMFERVGTQTSSNEPVSMAATRAIEAAINDRPGIHYQELTDPANSKPVFAVLFADAEQQPHFERLFESALKLCGLRVNLTREPAEALPASIADEKGKAELGYIDRERGFVLVIPSVRGAVKET
jgi:hypothetical protein